MKRHVIFKYALNQGVTRLRMKPGKTLYAAKDSREDIAVVWVQHDLLETSEARERVFHVVMTGEEFNTATKTGKLVSLGLVRIGEYILHVFEETA